MSSYDRERGRRYKKWWAHQKGPPQGQLIRVPPGVWVRHDQQSPPADRCARRPYTPAELDEMSGDNLLTPA